MLLIVYYVIFMIAGDLSAYLIGLIVEREFGSQASLIVFLALYFLFLWVSWLLAVWMTEPKRRSGLIPRLDSKSSGPFLRAPVSASQLRTENPGNAYGARVYRRVDEGCN